MKSLLHGSCRNSLRMKKKHFSIYCSAIVCLFAIILHHFYLFFFFLYVSMMNNDDGDDNNKKKTERYVWINYSHVHLLKCIFFVGEINLWKLLNEQASSSVMMSEYNNAMKKKRIKCLVNCDRSTLHGFTLKRIKFQFPTYSEKRSSSISLHFSVH